MSERSMIRARRRAEERHRRRAILGVAVVAAGLGATAALAPSAQAANFEVNSLLDNGNTICDATCTLRDAIETANIDTAPDTITFSSILSGTIVLTGGVLPVYSSMTIQGPGGDRITISGDANQNNVPDGADDRVFYVITDIVGDIGEPVTISGLSIEEGYPGGGTYGGGIYAFGSNLTLDEVVVADNSATYGGGIYIDEGNLTITDSTIRDNFAADKGGGIYIEGDNAGSSALVIRNSTISGNSAGGRGGGIYARETTDSALVAASTVSGNSSGSAGGGIYLVGMEVSQPVIQNSTISGNNAAGPGGGVYLDDQNSFGARFEGSTIVGNAAGVDGTGRGGGIARESGAAGPVSLSSTIVANNLQALGVPNDLADDIVGPPPVQIGFSLIENPGIVPLTQSPAGSNLLGIDPALGGLTDNGGPTRTHLPVAASPAVDAGIANGPATDQRNLPRTQQQPGANPAGGDGTDIGAVELPDAALEGASVSARKKQKAKGKKIKVVVKVGAAESVDALASGSIKAARKSYPLKDARASGIAAGATATLTLKPKAKKSSKRIAKVLGAGKRAKAKVSVLLTDGAGNTDPENVGVTLSSGGKKGKK